MTSKSLPLVLLSQWSKYGGRGLKNLNIKAGTFHASAHIAAMSAVSAASPGDFAGVYQKTELFITFASLFALTKN